jgi:hypothetical protein
MRMTGVWHQLASGQLTAATIVIWTCCGFVAAMLGGALAGILFAGKDLGNELAGAMGAMFGPTGAVPGVLLGLIILAML